jgi:hypothetical protein
MVALRAPIACGVNKTDMVQLSPGAKVEPQLFVWEKSPGLTPLIEIPEMASVSLPVFA